MKITGDKLNMHLNVSHNCSAEVSNQNQSLTWRDMMKATRLEPRTLEQPGVVESVPAHDRELELDDL